MAAPAPAPIPSKLEISSLDPSNPNADWIFTIVYPGIGRYTHSFIAGGTGNRYNPFLLTSVRSDIDYDDDTFKKIDIFNVKWDHIYDQNYITITERDYEYKPISRSYPVSPEIAKKLSDYIETIQSMRAEGKRGNLLFNWKWPSNEPMLPNASKPANAPAQCFDPIAANTSDIDASSAVFYVLNEDGTTAFAACLDTDSLDTYKSSASYLFYRCKDTVPESALFISRAKDIHPTPIRLLNFQQRIYVKDAEAKRLVAGNAYVLKPIEPLGRIVSEEFLTSEDAVSATHCGPADESKLYEIKKVASAGGARKAARKSRKAARKSRKSRKAARKSRKAARKSRKAARKSRKAARK